MVIFVAATIANVEYIECVCHGWKNIYNYVASYYLS